MRLFKSVFSVFLLLLVFHVSYVYAGDLGFVPANGLYIEASAVHNTIGHDFDDGHAWVAESGNIYMMPDVDSAYGFGVALGNRVGQMLFELGYQRVEHDIHSAYYGIGDQDSCYHAVDVNFRYEIFKYGRIRPNLLIGLSWLRYDIDQNMFDGVNLNDTTLYGVSGNLGGGLSCYLTQKLCIKATAIHRWNRFKKSDEGHSTPDILGNGMNYSVGVAYTF